MLIQVYIGIAICILISIIDARKYIIPDILLFFLALSFFFADLILMPTRIPLRIVQGFGLFVLFLLIYRFVGGFGFGDVKMIGILGYGFGFLPAVLICLFASVSALLLYSIKYIISADSHRKHLLLQKIPFAPFLTAGTAAVFLFREFIL